MRAPRVVLMLEDTGAGVPCRKGNSSIWDVSGFSGIIPGYVLIPV